MSTPEAVAHRARDYYNSADADNFYFHIWGGEDIHIGLYEQGSEDIRTASRLTVERLADRLQGIDAGANVLDLGAGYGGAARYLVKRFGCKVTAINLSEAENVRHRDTNAAEGLSQQIEVVDGNFEDLPFADGSFDFAWSQDAILHSARRERVVQEVARILRPGGEFIFTDPMQADDADTSELRAVLERIHLDSLASFAFYREAADRYGLEEIASVPMTEQLVRHYSRVREELQGNYLTLSDRISEEYLQRMLTGLGHWVDAGNAGRLAWGLMHYRKRES